MRLVHGPDLANKGLRTPFSGEKVAIVGRTGAGKTSLVLSIFRFLETVEGTIFVDGDDISKRNLCCHRTSINIIPQVHVSALSALLRKKHSNTNSQKMCPSIFNV